MKKQVLIFLTVFTILSTLAEEPPITNNTSVINLEQEKQIWKQTQHQSYLTHLAQRETFLQIENLLKSAVKNQQFSENTQELTKNLIRSIPEYPLQMDLILRFWETKIRFLKSNDEKNISLANNELDKLIAQNPLFITKSLKELKQKLKNLISDSKDISGQTIQNKDLQDKVVQIEDPAKLPEIIENSDPSTLKKDVLLEAFPRYLKTRPEKIQNPSFVPYQQWAEIWRLSEDELKQWKIAFLTRFFDNENTHFQAWRDTQITQLKTDNLTERRLRMAIWQKNDLTPWLSLLSDTAKEKQEWRYWIAKNDKQNITEKLTALSQERGFYPMLAAAQLKKIYKFDIPHSPNLSIEEQKSFESAFNIISELRELGRYGLAKQRWRVLLDNTDFNTQLKLAKYAQEQQWYELSVDSTIVAKAWDYLNLRLPNAYSDYFDIALKNLNISKTFSMAIARQESAWNPMALSSANAKGLMQLLPATAKLTAENNQIPYLNEQDLFKPLNNILLGTAHLNDLNNLYPNNRILIAASYNAGTNRVNQWLYRANNKLTLDEFVASIPFYETRDYVQNTIVYDFYYQILQQKENPQMFSQEEWDRLY